MEFGLTSEQQHIRSIARDFARGEVAPLAREADETGRFPLQVVRRMAELKLLAGPLPVEYGGAGLDYLSTVISRDCKSTEALHISSASSSRETC